MIRRMMSARIDDVAVPATVHAIGREPEAKALELLEALVAAGGPPPREKDDELWRVRVERPQKFGAEPRDRRRGAVVVEVEVVQEARGLADAEPQQRMNPRFGRVQHLHQVTRREPFV